MSRRAASRPPWGLAANRRPFLYFPLRHHFEQNFHVRYRLNRYRAAVLWTSRARWPDIAAAIAQEIGRNPDYRPLAAQHAPWYLSPAVPRRPKPTADS